MTPGGIRSYVVQDGPVSAFLIQISIGIVGATLGFVIGSLRGRGRLLRARQAAQQQIDDLQSSIAMNRFTIRELEAKLEEVAKRNGTLVTPLRVPNGANGRRTTPVWLDTPSNAGHEPPAPRA